MSYAMIINAVAAAPVVVQAGPRIISLVSKASKQTFTTLEGVWAWAKSGNGAAVATLSAVAAAGVSLVDLMMDSGFAKSFRSAKSVTVEDALKAIQAGTKIYNQLSPSTVSVLDRDADLHLDFAKQADRLEGKAVIEWAAPRFGYTSDAVVHYHSMLRAFLELDTATVTDLAELHL